MKKGELEVLAWTLRFNRNCKDKKSTSQETNQITPTNQLTLKESFGELKLFQLIQAESFSEEIVDLKSSKLLEGCFRKLDAFFDNRGLIRVGGRLKYGDFPYMHLNTKSSYPQNTIQSFCKEDTIIDNITASAKNTCSRY